MRKPVAILFGVLSGLLLFIACDENETEDPGYSLRQYIKDCGEPTIQLDSILSFATEVLPRYIENTGDPISIFFYPIGNPEEFKYFESNKYTTNLNDLTIFFEKPLELRSEFNGYLMRFLHTGIDFPRWGRITYKKNGMIYISSPVSVNSLTDSSEYFPGVADIDLSVPGSPFFSWERDTIAGTSSYFEIVSDLSGNLISGTFTNDKHFRFYDLSNVILNIHDVSPPPILSPGTTYRFTVMGIGHDYWVQMVYDTIFTAN
jgi:hypothetical protein